MKGGGFTKRGFGLQSYPVKADRTERHLLLRSIRIFVLPVFIAISCQQSTANTRSAEILDARADSPFPTESTRLDIDASGYQPVVYRNVGCGGDTFGVNTDTYATISSAGMSHPVILDIVDIRSARGTEKYTLSVALPENFPRDNAIDRQYNIHLSFPDGRFAENMFVLWKGQGTDSETAMATDSDTVANPDTSTNANPDSEPGGNADSESATDLPLDTDTEFATDTASPGDSESESDSGNETDSGSSVPTDADAESDAASDNDSGTGTEIEIDSDVETDTETDTAPDTDDDTATDTSDSLHIEAECAIDTLAGDCNGNYDGFRSEDMYDPYLWQPVPICQDTACKTVSYMSTGAWIAISDIDFMDYATLSIRISAGRELADVAIYLDDPETGELLARLGTYTGGPDTFKNISTSISVVTGVHTLYIVGGENRDSSSNGNIDWIELSTAETPINTAPDACTPFSNCYRDCWDCAKMGHCLEEKNTCENNPSCQNIYDCIDDVCNGPFAVGNWEVCFQNCVNSSDSEGREQFWEYRYCVMCDVCASQCSGELTCPWD
jgi:hypothetical protein